MLGPEAFGLRRQERCPVESWVLSERWVGGKVDRIRGEEKLETKVTYFIGNDPRKHRSGLATHRYLSLGEVWPGVEVKLKASQKTVEKLFFVSPGADLAKVRVQLRGAESLRLSSKGELVVQTGLGEVALSRPLAWQDKDGEKLRVQASYRLYGKDNYGFEVEGADPLLTLVIDPILQSTYLGGSGVMDWPWSLVVAPDGTLYAAGSTDSTDFPQTDGGAQGSMGGGDGFVARLNEDLTQFLQCTYLGGEGGDEAHALAVGVNGEVYVVGVTNSDNFPNTTGGAQPIKAAQWDAFVARLSPDLTQNPQSTYLGGRWNEGANAVAIAPNGVYVAGVTNSDNFPNTSGGAQPSWGGGDSEGDGFVARLNAQLTELIQATYLGGLYNDQANAIAIGPTGHVYVAGKTQYGEFPNTAGGAQPVYGGGYLDGFVARLSGDLRGNFQATYLGGSRTDQALAIAVAPSGAVYVAGLTDSWDFPNTSGGAQPQRGNPSDPYDSDAFVALLNAELTQNFQSTYLGGGSVEQSNAIAIHPTTAEIYVAGETWSQDFPNTTGGAQPTNAGGAEAFVARFNSSLTSNLQSTYLGGTGWDYGKGLAISPSGDVYVLGLTGSSDFPRTSGGAQENIAVGWDAFVARLTADLAALYSLTVSKSGAGSGTIYATGCTLTWGGATGTCTATHGTSITLSAVANTGSTFAGWSGGTGSSSSCVGTGDCTFVISSDSTVTALFTLNEYQVTANATGTGSGSVSSNPVAISFDYPTTSSGTATFSHGTNLVLTATASSNSTASWITCPGTTLGNGTSQASCSISNLDAPKTAEATFTLVPATSYALNVAKSGSGSGTVTSTPPGISCGDDCVESYPPEATVTLTATPSGGSTFGGWSGDCSSCGTNSTCQITMDADKTCIATFNYSPPAPPPSQPPQYILTVAKSGTGSGTVASSPSGITCGTDCSEAYGPGTTVTLTATPDAGSVFTGWSGDCSGTDTTATVTMTGPKMCIATFQAGYTLSVAIAGTGSGTVTSSPAGISCGSDCSEAYNPGTNVTLTATPDTGSVFTGWSGDCSGTNATVTVTMNSNKTCTATFTQQQYTLTVTKSGTGSGTVTSSPSGITCGTDCSEAYGPGTTVTLTATPDTGSAFTGWSGDCSWKELTVTVTIDTDKTCTATFSPASGPDLTGSWARLTHSCKNTPAGLKCKLKGTLTVENRGNRPAPPGAPVYFYLSSDGSWDSGDSLLRSVELGALNAGQSKTRKFNYTLPLGQSAQGKYVIAWIDATDSVAEINEANNIVVSSQIP